MKYVHVHIIVLGIHMRSGPHANSMHLRHGRPSCARACQLMTFLIVMDTYVHHENRSLIQSLPLMSLEMPKITCMIVSINAIKVTQYIVTGSKQYGLEALGIKGGTTTQLMRP